MLALVFAIVTQSIVTSLDEPLSPEPGQVNVEMMDKPCGCKTRVMSFNMLFDSGDRHLKEQHRWPNRKMRVIEYIQHTQPDVIGSQELQENQRADLMEGLGEDYDYVGGERAIFYKKDRLRLICSQTRGRLTWATFERDDGVSFTLLNTHLSFANVERRLAEAKQLAKMATEIEGPLVVTGDMNTFPMRPELFLPFYDGDYIMSILEGGSLRDARTVTLCGHYGPISSTNFAIEKGEPFESEGTPGVILDHILVNPCVRVITHGIDPAQVDGLYPSDHFPVLADLCFIQES